MPNRAIRRIKHRLIIWPKHKPSPFRGIKIGGSQKIWTCSCGQSWMIITNEKPIEAHQKHIEDFLKEDEE